MRPAMRPTAWWAMNGVSREIVLRVGREHRPASMSSMPMTAMSCGTRSPASKNAFRAPTASRSQEQQIPSGRGDAPAPDGDQVLGGALGGALVVDRDVVVASVELVLAEQDEREARAGAHRAQLRARAERAEADAIEQHLAVPTGEQLAFVIVPGLVDHHAVDQDGCRVDHIAGELAEAGDVDLGHHQGITPVCPVRKVRARRFGRWSSASIASWTRQRP